MKLYITKSFSENSTYLYFIYLKSAISSFVLFACYIISASASTYLSISLLDSIASVHNFSNKHIRRNIPL